MSTHELSSGGPGGKYPPAAAGRTAAWAHVGVSGASPRRREGNVGRRRRRASASIGARGPGSGWRTGTGCSGRRRHVFWKPPRSMRCLRCAAGARFCKIDLESPAFAQPPWGGRRIWRRGPMTRRGTGFGDPGSGGPSRTTTGCWNCRPTTRFERGDQSKTDQCSRRLAAGVDQLVHRLSVPRR